MNPNSKALILLTAAFFLEGQRAAADGKFTVSDFFGFLDEGMQIPDAITKWKPAVAEFKALDDAGRSDLVTSVQKAFSLESKKAELLIEGAFEMLIAGEKIWSAFQIEEPAA